jgi:hypothetical protein
MIRRRPRALLIAVSVFVLAACAVNTSSPQDVALHDAASDGRPDHEGEGAAPDATSSKDRDPSLGNIGEGCTKKADCTGKDAVCLVLNSTVGSGVCTLTCTPDDTKTPLYNEDTCPSGFVCGEIEMSSGTKKDYCLQKCTPSFTKNPCPSTTKVACHPRSTRFAKPGQAVCYYLACTTDKDCPVYAKKICQTDGDCSGVASDAFCSSNVCARPGNCTAGGICGVHTGLGKTSAAVGDPCQSDMDCPENGGCFYESKSATGSIGTAFHNGYCVVRYCSFPKTLTDFTCPSGSVCYVNYYGGYCFKSCKVDSTTDCRDYSGDDGGDYECYDWTGWTYKGVKMASTPICINASTETCNSLGTSSCESLGDSTNSTNMTCRDRTTGAKKSNINDPAGVCLDDTASGAYKPSPDGGAADSLAKDGGGAAVESGPPDLATTN